MAEQSLAVPVALAGGPTAPAPAAAMLDGPAGAPVLVLGNSLGTSAAVWDNQVPEFLTWFRLLRYELPGHGGTPAAPGAYSIGGLAAGVLALLDSLGVERAAYCGISLGGMIGMWLAAHEPDRISALGLVCTAAWLPPADAWRARAAQVRAAGMAPIAAAALGRWFTPAYANRAPEVIRGFAAEFERTDPAGYAGCCEAIAAMDLRPDLPAIAAPTLVLTGADDPATPLEHGAAIAGLIPGALLDVIPAAAHLAAVEAPGPVTAALLAHLRAATGSGGGGVAGR
ncbi:MAG: 3-oxoadipate enol-lactonase [Streptosporangiaceae bacterium]